MVRDNWLDELRFYEDITYPDSAGHRILAIQNGSYVLVESGRAALYGESYLIASGQFVQICQAGESVVL